MTQDLQPNDIWSALGIHSREEFDRLLPVISFPEAIPEDVSHRLQVLRTLVHHCYYAPELLDAAVEHVLLSFELALRKRHELAGSPELPDTRLVSLVTWAGEAGMFDEPVKVAHTVRDFRNRTFHPRGTQRLGIVAPDLIQRIVDITCGLYEDPQVRAARFAEESRLRTLLDGVFDRGGVLTIDGVPHSVVIARLLIADAHASPARYCLLFWPLIDLTIRDGQVDEGKPLWIVCSAVESSGPERALFFLEHKTVAHLEVNACCTADFQKWKDDFENSPLRVVINASISRHRGDLLRRARTRR